MGQLLAFINGFDNWAIYRMYFNLIKWFELPLNEQSL